MDEEKIKKIKSVAETLLFVNADVTKANILAKIFSIEASKAKEIFHELKKEYEEQKRGIRIREIEDGFQLVSCNENYEYIKPVLLPKKERSLSQAALEVLTIIAYKGPITKPEIDSIRGVKSERVVFALSEKELIEEAGKSNAIGKPTLYKTTTKFLELMNIKSLEDLPSFSVDDDAIFEADKVNKNYNQKEFDI